MRKSFVVPAALFVIACVSAPVRADLGDTTELDQKFDQPLHMRKYGGLKKDLVVHETDQDGIRYSIIDYTRMIWRPQSTGQFFPNRGSYSGNGGYVQVPTVTTHKRRNGNPDHGSGRLDGQYLLFEEPSTGLRIYFKDTLATPSDAVRLRIVSGERAH